MTVETAPLGVPVAVLGAVGGLDAAPFGPCRGGCGGSGVDPPVPVPQAQRRPLQELRLQQGAERTNITPLLRRLRLKVGAVAGGRWERAHRSWGAPGGSSGYGGVDWGV